MNRPLVLSIGAHGKFAGLVVPELVRHGATVRGLIRKPEDAEKARANGAAEVAMGDLQNPSTVDAALKGVDGVFYIAPVFAPGETDLGLNLIASAKRAGVRRFVFSSVLHPSLNLANHAAKLPVESALCTSGMEFVILQPAVFFQNLQATLPFVLKHGIIAQPYSKTARTVMVDYRDVAEVAAIALTGDSLAYGTYELCADGLPNREDIANLIGEVMGRKIQAAEPAFSEWAAKAHLSYNADQMQQLEAMFAHYDAHGLMGNSQTLRAILGREPRSLRQFIEEHTAHA